MYKYGTSRKLFVLTRNKRKYKKISGANNYHQLSDIELTSRILELCRAMVMKLVDFNISSDARTSTRFFFFFLHPHKRAVRSITFFMLCCAIKYILALADFLTTKFLYFYDYKKCTNTFVTQFLGITSPRW